jgi:thioredoxin-like negative regulator of GroEL
MDNFIKNNRVCLVYFTNGNFTELNNKISGLQHSISDSKFLVIDSDKHLDIIKELNIKSIPLIHIYKNGKLIEEIFGTYNNICDIIRLHF